MIKQITSAGLLATALTLNSLVIAEERMQVTASRIDLPVTASLNDVIIIDRDAIEASAATTLFELMRGQAGLDLVRRGGQGQQISLFVRGANSNQLLVLIDGVEVGSATLGSKALSDISVSQIQRIELIKGPRAALWGSKAMGGVLQIFTREIDELELTLGAGSDGFKSLGIATGIKFDQFELQLIADNNELDGIDTRFDQDPDLDGSERENLQFRARWNASDNHQFSFLQQINEGFTEYDSAFGGDQLVFDNLLQVLEYQGQLDAINHGIKLSKQRDDSTTQGANATSFRFITESEMLRYQMAYKASPNWQFGASLETLDEDVSESVTDYLQDQRTTRAGHLYSHYQTDDWVNEVALRMTDIEGLPDNTSTHFGLGYRITEKQLISINVGEGFKAPTFNDLYFPFGGNPNLQYETSDSVELTYQHWLASGQFSISFYDNEVQNLIQYVPDANGVFNAENVGQVTLKGIDFSWNWQANNMNHQISASYVDAKNEITGADLQLRAAEQLSYSVNGTVADYSAWSYQLQALYTGKRPDLDYQTFSNINLDATAELHLSTTYQLTEQIQLQLRVDDLFNAQAINNSGYRPEGRTYKLFFVIR